MGLLLLLSGCKKVSKKEDQIFVECHVSGQKFINKKNRELLMCKS